MLFRRHRFDKHGYLGKRIACIMDVEQEETALWVADPFSCHQNGTASPNVSI